MDVTVRLTWEQDYRATEEVTREAFWNLHVPGCDEHLLLHNLRQSECYIPALDFTAVKGPRVVGHIAYAKAFIETSGRCPVSVVTFGPLSVLPSLQGQGIGAKLVSRSLKEAAQLGFRAVFIYGDPAYYSRFGFQSAQNYGIGAQDGSFPSALMALPLYKDALKGVSGRLVLDPVYTVDASGLEAFDKTFPYREKRVTDTQWKHGQPDIGRGGVLLDVPALTQEILAELEHAQSMVLATAVGGRVTARTVSPVNDGLTVLFQTGARSEKARHIRENNKVALAAGNIQAEGVASLGGHPRDNSLFWELYRQKHPRYLALYGDASDAVVSAVRLQKAALYKYIENKPCKDILYVEENRAYREWL